MSDDAVSRARLRYARISPQKVRLVADLVRGEDVEDALARVMPWREAVAATAAHNPHSGRHLLALFDAEVAVARGDVLEASVQYDQAIEAAPSRVVIYDRLGQPAMDLGGHRTYYGTGSDLPNTLDLESGEFNVSEYRR